MFLVYAQTKGDPGFQVLLDRFATEGEASTFIGECIANNNEVVHHGVHYWWIKDDESYSIVQRCAASQSLPADDDDYCGLGLECEYGPENHPAGEHMTHRIGRDGESITLTWPGEYLELRDHKH